MEVRLPNRNLGEDPNKIANDLLVANYRTFNAREPISLVSLDQSIRSVIPTGLTYKEIMDLYTQFHCFHIVGNPVGSRVRNVIERKWDGYTEEAQYGTRSRCKSCFFYEHCELTQIPPDSMMLNPYFRFMSLLEELKPAEKTYSPKQMKDSLKYATPQIELNLYSLNLKPEAQKMLVQRGKIMHQAITTYRQQQELRKRSSEKTPNIYTPKETISIYKILLSNYLTSKQLDDANTLKFNSAKLDENVIIQALVTLIGPIKPELLRPYISP